jgi:hypothetical protein
MGGAAGHMRHPFDLQSVQSGEDLINIFEDLKLLVGSGTGDLPNVKFDGANVSFKVDANGRMVVDRGSYADVSGIGFDNIFDRFPKEGHGMRNAIPTVLTIMSQAGIEPELRALGLYDNPHYFINTEFAEAGTSNATAYDGNYIFLHGVNAFYESTYRKVTRPGLEKPLMFNPRKGREEPTKDKSVEVPYDKAALASLVEKANAVAQTMDPPFTVVGPVPVRTLEESEINYEPALLETITIPVSDNYLAQDSELSNLQGSSLQSWLMSIQQKPAQYYAPHYDVEIPKLGGKKINPYHKATYLSVIQDGVNVDEIVPAEHVRTLINGIIILHATRKLGQRFLLGLTSDFGNLIASGIDPNATDHEGVVIRNQQFSNYPFKITGEFIVTGMFGNFSNPTPSTSSVTEGTIRKMVRSSIRRTMMEIFRK